VLLVGLDEPPYSFLALPAIVISFLDLKAEDFNESFSVFIEKFTPQSFSE
jgi:hypothetical protein